MMSLNPPPRSLQDVAVQTTQGGNFSLLLSDFLDDFYRCPTPEALTARPTLMVGQHPEGSVLDAFLGAAAHSLSNSQGWPGPSWAFEEGRYLQRPFFPIRAPSFRATLLLESPPPFRSRNLFVTANALSRA